MEINISNGGVPKLIDELLLKYKELYLPDVGITVTTVNATYVGVLSERTAEFIVLKTDLRRKIVDGPAKGKAIYQNHYIQVQSVIGITFETAE
jgi:sulfur transfer complex TusBCD TusB component (DsrH family)